jgi:hypothetical protein
VLPTAHKAKLPNTFSYPLGAKVVSDALAGVPQEHLLEVEFHFYRMSEYVRKRWAELLHRDRKAVQLPVVGFRTRDWNGLLARTWPRRATAIRNGGFKCMAFHAISNI